MTHLIVNIAPSLGGPGNFTTAPHASAPNKEGDCWPAQKSNVGDQLGVPELVFDMASGKTDWRQREVGQLLARDPYRGMVRHFTHPRHGI